MTPAPEKGEALSAEDALTALNELRSNIVATQSASWSNTVYSLVAILDAAGLDSFDPSDEQLAQHLSCYGGAGGFPGRLKAEPDRRVRLAVQRLRARREKRG